MSKQSTLSGGIFGLSCKRESARVILTPVPWEVTTSYGSGTSRGPEAILKASPQVDLYDPRYGDAYKAGFFWNAKEHGLMAANEKLKPIAAKVVSEWDEFGEINAKNKSLIEQVNSGCAAMVQTVYDETKTILAHHQIPAVVGGDHSTPLGAIKAVCEKHPQAVGILHIDAHADLRLAYQGFTYSHASIMRNVCSLELPPKKLVQVAIRDYCQEEFDFIRASEGVIRTHFDPEVKKALFSGANWRSICDQIVSELPNLVYVSFDIDGLSPDLCPHTGTPVPGGLSFDQVSYLLETLGTSGRKIVGFDLNEVAPGEDEWDANVGARILFQLCSWAVFTNK